MNSSPARTIGPSLSVAIAFLLLPFLTRSAQAFNCSMHGPSGMGVGTQATYQVDIEPDVEDINWTIAGDGLIVSSTRGTFVIVQSTAPGSFLLTANVKLLNNPNVVSCPISVTVRELDCTISGPTQLYEHTNFEQYQIPAQPPGVTIDWQITGNAGITSGTHGEVVSITVGVIGQFTISVTLTKPAVTPSTCSLTVPVLYDPSLPHPNANAKLLIHLASATVHTPCTTSAPSNCNSAVTAGRLYPQLYNAYLLVADGNPSAGVGGMQCGIDYNPLPQAGVDVFAWVLCGSLQFASSGPNGPWPAAGSGNLVTWDVSQRCQQSEPGGAGTGVLAKAGYFYLAAYTPDVLRVIPRPVDNQAKVASCGAIEDLIGGSGSPVQNRLGSARFSAAGNQFGYNPCSGPIPVLPTTWSAIKGLYSR